MIKKCPVVVLDCEGKESQEIAEICIDTISIRIKDVYLNWANFSSKERTCDNDWFSRKYAHGLNRAFLANNRLANEDELISDFQSWLKCICLVGQIVQLECFRMSHLMKALDIGEIFCSRETVHYEYSRWPRHKTSGDHVQ